MSDDTFINATRKALEERSRKKTLAKIAEESGLTEAWLEAFGSGRIKDPSARRVERLYTHLTGSPLFS